MNKAYILRVKKANDIVDVISEVMPLETQEGKENLIGYCPFTKHSDGIGRFEVNRRKQLCKCWLCGEGGDVIKFISIWHSVPHRKGVSLLAERAGMTPPKERPIFESEINPRELWHGVFVPHWLLRRDEVSQGAKLCYARLGKYFNTRTGQCNPKHKTLAEELGIKERMARMYINELVEHKLIKPQRQYGPGKSNNYGFLRHKWFEGALLRKNAPEKKTVP